MSRSGLGEKFVSPLCGKCPSRIQIQAVPNISDAMEYPKAYYYS